MFYGFINLCLWDYAIISAVSTHITIIAVTVFLHRCQAHRALTLHAIPSHFFRAWLWLTTGMETKAWAAIHRKHHAKCETLDDPHSPVIMGLKTVLMNGSELYRREAKNKETLARYGAGTPNDWLERYIYTPHSAKGIFISLTILLLLFGVPGIIMWCIQMAWIPFFAAGIINGVGHFFGYRNFECTDAATNILPWGILIGGEELHNNHHTYPASAKLSVKYWEFDIGWLYIRILSLCKLATIKRLPPKVVLIPSKRSIDLDTLKAIIANRFFVLSQYSAKVMLPTFHQEKSKISKHRISSRIKASIITEKPFIDSVKQENLQLILGKAKNLQVVYEFRQSFLKIWECSKATHSELLAALQQWCEQAEDTEIYCLKIFVKYLKSYTIATDKLQTAN